MKKKDVETHFQFFALASRVGHCSARNASGIQNMISCKLSDHFKLADDKDKADEIERCAAETETGDSMPARRHPKPSINSARRQ